MVGGNGDSGVGGAAAPVVLGGGGDVRRVRRLEGRSGAALVELGDVGVDRGELG